MTLTLEKNKEAFAGVYDEPEAAWILPPPSPSVAVALSGIGFNARRASPAPITYAILWAQGAGRPNLA